jgi:hypothetical protein
MNWWDRIVVLIAGKRIGVLGSRAAGKTTLNTYLREGRVLTEYEPTLGTEAVASGRPQVRQLEGATQGNPGVGKIAIRRGRDVPGDSKTNQADWQDIVMESQALVYLFDVHRLLKQERAYSNQIVYDCQLVGGFLEDRLTRDGAAPQVGMLGTHCDLEPDYAPPDRGSGHLDFYSRVSQRKAVDDARRALGAAQDRPPPLLVGSLKDAESAGELSWRILKQEFHL